MITWDCGRLAGRCFLRFPGNGVSSTWLRMLKPMPTIGSQPGRWAGPSGFLNCPSLADAEAMVGRVTKRFAKENPQWVKWLEENIAEGFTVYRFARSTHRKIRTVNGLEPVNKEIRRRTRVVGIFPNEESVLRLTSAVLAEIHEEWLTGRQYLNLADWSTAE